MKTLAPGTFFLIGVLYLPTEAERINGAKKTVIVEPQYVLADDMQAAVNKAVMLAAQKDAKLDPDRFEVLATNPF